MILVTQVWHSSLLSQSKWYSSPVLGTRCAEAVVPKANHVEMGFQHRTELNKPLEKCFGRIVKGL